ncbi:MAG: OprO/OprP family phosphate-selective porin [Planctomycetota bacterium]
MRHRTNLGGMLAKSPRDRLTKLPKVFGQSLLGLALLTWTAYGPEALVHAQQQAMGVAEPKPIDSASKDIATPSGASPKTQSEQKSDPEKWNVKLGGHVQMDYVLWANAPESIPNTNNYFNFRRLRLVADGTGYDVCDFRLQMTLEPEPFGDVPEETNLTPQVKDAYFSMNQIPYLGRFRIGNFFVPYSLEQVTNDTNNIFLERSIPTQTVFAADREVGFAFYNCSQDERLTWTTGCFFDSISEGFKKRLDDNQGYRVSGRLTWLPYDNDQPKSRRLVHTGLGVLFSDDNDDRIRIRTRPQVSEGPRLIDSGLLKADTYTSGNVETAIVLGRFAVQSEAFLGTVQMLNGDNPTLNGAYVHTSWFVTGESRIFERFGQHGAQFGRNAPFENFRFKRGEFRPGALELKSRWSFLDMNQLNAGRYNDLTVGFNWYWSDRTRWMFDWIHPITTDQTLYGATVSDLLAMRFDFNW